VQIYILSLFVICYTINLSDYKFPTKDSSDRLFRVPILATNDLHGGIFPTQFYDKNNVRYSNGGGINLYSYAKILKEQWGDQLLWLDGGDQFIGTMECMLSNCLIMRDYYNKVGVQGIGLGNHDFDYGIDYLKEYIKKQNFPVLAANVKNTKTGKYLYEEWENLKAYRIYELGANKEIKIGVIGLATKSTPSQTSTDLSDLVFEDYLTVTKKMGRRIKESRRSSCCYFINTFWPSM